MQTHNLPQGSAAWHAHRLEHFNASDAPAMLGCSPYQSRSELLHALHTGLRPEVDAATQRRFDDGHRYEALARPVAEKIIDDDLYPVVGSDGRLSASFDGLTMDESTAFEHKSLNDELRGCMGPSCIGRDLPKQYRVQMEQQLLVSGAERVLFMASKWAGDEIVEERHCWYASDPALRAEIVAGWAQFEVDLAAYTPVEVISRPAEVGHSPDQLPSLRSSVRGELVLESNIKEWEAAALAYIESVRAHELKTDKDFEDADAAAKWCDSSKETLLGVKASLMSATGDVNTAVGTLDRIVKELDQTRIAFNNAIKARKETRKTEIVAGGAAKLREHVQALNERVGQALMPAAAAVADFAGAVKGKSSLAKMQEAVDATLANAKVAANQIADLIQRNRGLLRPKDGETRDDRIRLFPDFATVCTKPHDDFQNMVTARVAAEERQLEQERDRIRAEESARLEREQQARVAEERRQREEQEAAARALEYRRIPAGSGGEFFAPEPAATAIEAIVAATPNVVPMRTAAPVAPKAPASISITALNDALGLNVTSGLLEKVGFPPSSLQGKAGKFYSPDDLAPICTALSTYLLERARFFQQQQAA